MLEIVSIPAPVSMVLLAWAPVVTRLVASPLVSSVKVAPPILTVALSWFSTSEISPLVLVLPTVCVPSGSADSYTVVDAPPAEGVWTSGTLVSP